MKEGEIEARNERFAGTGVNLDAKVQNETDVTRARGAEQLTVGVCGSWDERVVIEILGYG